MISQKFSYLHKFLFIFSFLFLLSGCDIIDSVMGGGQTDPDDSKAIDRIEVEFLIDNAKSRIEYHNPPEHTDKVQNLTGKEIGADITTIAGSSAYKEETYFTDFHGIEILGRVIGGSMRVKFISGDPRKVNINISQGRSHTSSFFGDVHQQYFLKYNGIRYNKSYTSNHTDLEVDEYYVSKPTLNSTTCYFTENNDIYFDKTVPTTSGSRAFIKVKVHYK